MFSSSHLEHSALPQQSRGPLTFSHPRHPRAPRLVSQLHSEDFFVNRDESTFHPPRGLKSKASLASNPMEGLHQRTLRQGEPSSLVKMILKVEKRGFRTMEKRDQKVLHVGELSLVIHGMREEASSRKLQVASCSCKLFSLLKKLCEACLAGGKLCLPPERFTPSTRTGSSHTNDSFADV